MSGLRPDAMRQFYRRLWARQMDTTKLADALSVSRPAVTRVLNGARRRGPLWPKVVALLQPEEIALLNVAQSDPWNKNRVAKRPRWNPNAAWRKQILSQ